MVVTGGPLLSLFVRTTSGVEIIDDAARDREASGETRIHDKSWSAVTVYDYRDHVGELVGYFDHGDKAAVCGHHCTKDRAA
jgi:hypothetical protein